jgi:hypothetical protein
LTYPVIFFGAIAVNPLHSSSGGLILMLKALPARYLLLNSHLPLRRIIR